MLELKNVCFSYTRNASVINDISLKVDSGEFIGVLGHNGAGKTTLFKLILKLLTPTKGSISVCIDPNFTNNSFSYMPETDGIYERLTGYENLNFRAKIAKIHKHDVLNLSSSILNDLRLNKGLAKSWLLVIWNEKKLSLHVP